MYLLLPSGLAVSRGQEFEEGASLTLTGRRTTGEGIWVWLRETEVLYNYIGCRRKLGRDTHCDRMRKRYKYGYINKGSW